MPTITITNQSATIPAMPGHSLLISLLNGLQPIHTICGGRAKCGCCRIHILSGNKGLSPINTFEKKKFGADDLKKGWRLACQTHTLRDVSLHLPSSEELEPHCKKE